MDRIEWDELAAATRARQFPVEPPATAAGLLGRIGPIQAQTARSPFLGLAARSPGLTRDQITAAYEEHLLLRGSTLRGTVHTATPAQHGVIDPVTRIAQRRLWERQFPLRHTTMEQLWSMLEDYAADQWRSPAELADRQRSWLSEQREDEAAQRLADQHGRSFAFGHGGLIRRPLSGGWETQVAPGYRTADRVADRGDVPADPIVSAIRLHLGAHGPASRYDLAWWSGLKLREIDRALGELELVARTGPDDRIYLDLPGAPAPTTETGIRLLPEFDAILCGYDPKARDRFITPEHHRLLWSNSNGLILPPLLVDGRVGGFWRLSGTGRTRSLEIRWLTRRPRTAELTAPIDTLAAALHLTVAGVTVSRA